MVTKTHKADLGLGLPEKKKKKKKMIVKEPETQYSVLNNDNYFSDQSPPRTTSHFNLGQGPVPEMCMGKKKKKKKVHSFLGELPQLPEPKLCARRAKSYSPGKQAHDQLEYICLEKKKKRKSLPMIASHGSWLKTSPDRRKSEEVTKGSKKLKKHKKEKRARDLSTFSLQDRWLYEAGDALHACSVGKETEEQMASGQKRKQGNAKEHNVKVKKKKKIHPDRETHLGQPRGSKSVESNPRKGSKKKPVKMEALEFIPIGDGPKTPGKKKMKAKKKVEQPVEELALKRKKKKRKECGEVKDPWEEASDTDLEVVLEKKGNMDEACIDQVRRKALQEEIDRESGKTEAADSKSWTGTQFGQWDTAGFESEEQKLKFLKLMGGFKHLTPPASRSPSTVGKPNMALSKKEADSLQHNLQQDYDRAMSWKCSRGAGLGYTATPDKVFYIDRNASRSIKLSD